MPNDRILRERVAGQSAMAEVVRGQAVRPPRGRLARILGRSPLDAGGRVAYRGALGEQLVGLVLEGLGPRWDVLHDLPLGGATLDHLVIGPAGVFTVRVVDASGGDATIDATTLTIAARPHADLAIARAEAATVTGILSTAAGEGVHVEALLVVVDPRRLVVTTPAHGVRVVASRDLARSLTRAPATLDGDTVARISDHADLVATWPVNDDEGVDSSETDVARLHREFAAVRHEVRTAIGRRVLVFAAAAGGVFGIVWGLVASFVGMVVRG